MGGGRKRPGGGRDDKAERLAEALRENLRRRKAQARARAAESRPGDRDDRGDCGNAEDHDKG